MFAFRFNLWRFESNSKNCVLLNDFESFKKTTTTIQKVTQQGLLRSYKLVAKKVFRKKSKKRKSFQLSFDTSGKLIFVYI